VKLRFCPMGAQVVLLSPKEVSATKEKIVKAAGKRGRTKTELAEKLGVGHSYVSRLVNELYDDGKLVVIKTKKRETGRPAPVYAAR
jgi:predicted ArsR family transcriptional regulator